MRKNPNSKSGLFNLRVLFTFILCFVGVSLALFSLASSMQPGRNLVAPIAVREHEKMSQANRTGFWKQPKNWSSGASYASLRLNALQQTQALLTSGAMRTTGGSWMELGPSPLNGLNPLGGFETMSGQLGAIAVDLTHDPSGNLVYIGSSSGGLWKSTNGLASSPFFLPLSDQSQSLSVGAIALDTRTDPPTIYVGSGAPDNSSNISAYTGVGILISHDNGLHWTAVSSADAGAESFVGLGFSRILIDPVNSDILLASTGFAVDGNFPHSSVPQGDNGSQNLGVYRSSDSGSTWTKVLDATFGCFSGGDPCFPHVDLLYEPTQDVYYAAISGQGFYRSNDRGATWKSFADLGLGLGLPGPDHLKRVSLATRGGTLWALIMIDSFVTSNAFELFQSDDHGGSWHQLSPTDQSFTATLNFKGFLMYVAAPPSSSTLVIATDQVFRKDNIQDATGSWNNIEHNLHGDQHPIAFANDDTWYVGDDGGAWVTTDRGDTWNSLNDELRTLEFFSADADSSDSGNYVGGMQDNGNAFTTGGPTWNQIAFGDGGYVSADPQDSSAFFMLQPSGNRQETICYFTVSSPTPSMIVQFSNTDFLMPFELLPNDPVLYKGVTSPPGFNYGRSRILLSGGDNPWLVAFDPPTTSTAKVRLTSAINNTINYVAPAPSDPTTAYVVANTSLYRLSNISFNGGATATSLAGPSPGAVLGHLAVSPTDPATLYLIKVGFVDGEKIYKTEDSGGHWTNISGNLPNIPLNWVRIDPTNPNLIIVATDIGVFAATDGGVSGEQWKILGSGLPNVPVVQTKISPHKNLIAATYGRDVWTLDISKLEVQPVAKCKDVTVPTDPDKCSAASVSIDNGSTDPDGDSFTISQSPPGPYPKGTTAVTLTITDQNDESSQCTANVTVQDKQPPMISCPSPVVECTGPGGAVVTLAPTVSDNCPSLGLPACSPPSGSTFPLGNTPFSCTVTDASGNSSTCSSVVKVQDTTPPSIASVTANPNTLWPPNHTLVPVTVAVSVHDTCDPNPTCVITSITSNESPTGKGSGNTSPDYQVTGPLSANLRAERDGNGSGRVYTIAVQCTDHSNNTSQGTTTVTVPHNQ